MFAYILLALLFAVATTAQTTTTYFVGCTSSSNCSWFYPEHWSNGVPDSENHIAIINETACYACDITVEQAVTVGELHLLATTSTGPYIYIQDKFLVQSKLVIGQPTVYSYCSYIYFDSPTAEIHFATDSEVTIYNCYSDRNFYIRSITGYTGRIVNNGTITVLPSTTSIYTYYFDADDLTIDNWGNWVVDTTGLYVSFNGILNYNHYAGWYNTTNVTSTEPSINWYNTDLNIHSSDITFNGPWKHYSSYYNSYSSISSSYVNRVVFGAESISLSHGWFYQSNIYFHFPGTISDSTFYYATLNTTTANDVTLSGEIVLDVSILLVANDGADTDTLTVTIEDGAHLTTDGYSYVGELGNVIFINNGTISDVTLYLYIDETAWFINTGLIELSSSSVSVYAYGSATTAGHVVNKGTIQLTEGSSLYWYDEGNFYQCESSWIKLGFGTPESTNTPGSITFSIPYLSGYIAAYFGSGYTYTYYERIFTYAYSLLTDSEGKISSDVSITSTFEDAEDIINIGPQKLCTVPTYGWGAIFPILKGSCSSQYTDATSDTESFLTGNACSEFDYVEDLVASCPISANCGSLETNIPVGESGSASLQTSVAFLISSLAFLFFKY